MDDNLKQNFMLNQHIGIIAIRFIFAFLQLIGFVLFISYLAVDFDEMRCVQAYYIDYHKY